MIVVSVDWDFFIWNGREVSAETFLPDTLSAPIPTASIFEWDQDESEPAHRQIVRWLGRAQRAADQGVDLEREMNIRVDRGCTAPVDFLDAVGQAFDLSRATMMFADSHRTGMWAVKTAAREHGGPVQVVNFDAHADLGYDPDWMARKPLGHYDCADWLHEAIRRNAASHAEIVYPDWKRYAEWETIRDLPNVRRVKGRVTPITWTEWRGRRSGRVPVGVLLVVRSSTWTPPWMDRLFLETIPRFGVPNPICLDQDPEAYGRDVLPSSLRLRPWFWTTRRGR